MRLRSLLTSSVFHILLIVLLTVGIHFDSKDELDIPPPMTVELAKVDDISQTPEPAPTPPKPQPQQLKEKPEPAKKDDKPKPAPTNTSNVPVTPVEKPEETQPAPPPPTPEVRPKTIKKPDVKKKEPEPEETNKKASEKQPEPKKEEKPDKPSPPKRDFGSVLKNLAQNDETGQEATSKDDENSAAAPQAQQGPELTVSELDALRAQLEGCWNVPIGARGVEDMTIEINIKVNQDRTVRDARIVDQSRYSRDSFFRAVADTAKRAVLSPACSPLKLPEDKYTLWNNIIIDFNPRTMF